MSNPKTSNPNISLVNVFLKELQFHRHTSPLPSADQCPSQSWSSAPTSSPLLFSTCGRGSQELCGHGAAQKRMPCYAGLAAPDIAAESCQKWSLLLFKHQDFKEKTLQRAKQSFKSVGLTCPLKIFHRNCFWTALIFFLVSPSYLITSKLPPVTVNENKRHCQVIMGTSFLASMRHSL